ncbi:MAG: sulfite reductase subunit alpha [Verrucomicrobiota bacterium]
MNYPYFPEDAPFSEGQRSWLGGFFAGLNSRLLEAKENDSQPSGAAANAITVLYGTQTGNAEELAHETSEKALEFGLEAKVLGMDEVSPESFKSFDRLLLITSTYGDGEMPDNAQGLWDAMSDDSVSRLEDTHFAVLGLGDTSYDLFCQAAKDWEKRLEELGAKKVADRVDCDLEYEEPFAKWTGQVLPALAELGGGVAAPVAATNGAAVAKTKLKWSKKTPFPAVMLKNKVLTKNASSKETRHYEISLEDSGIEYDVGDALGVIPTNCPELVSQLTETLKLNPEEPVTVADETSKPLREALLNDFEIKLPSKELIAAVAERSGNEELNKLLLPENKEQMSEFLWGRDLIDFVSDYGDLNFTAEEFVALLKRVQPRLYSISSSIRKHPGEVHLTVASVRYDSHGRERKGVCSTFLADRIGDDVPVNCYLAPNKSFGVPSDDNAPMIMVGPGTGIAPFRAFLEEREVREAPGKNWLFFGERNRESDFFYEDELQALQKKGILTRLDLAFSRDQSEKIYVQDRMREQGAELFSWLEEGGYFFVCGDAYRMAKDVDRALHEIIVKHGKRSEEDATAYIAELKKAKRYVRDVY